MVERAQRALDDFLENALDNLIEGLVGNEADQVLYMKDGLHFKNYFLMKTMMT